MYRKYYKFGTTINGTVTGSPTINNGIVSGFSSSKYITSTLPIPQEGINTFEVYTKITTPSTLNNYGYIIAPSKDGTHWISFETQYSGQDDSIALVFYDNDTYWGYQAFSNNLQTSTAYWCKWIYDGINVKGYYSLDGNTYILFSTTTSSSQLTNALSKFITSNIRIGCDMSGSNVNNGSIDLTQTYIKINGNIVWSGTNIEEGTSSDYIFYKDFYDYKAKKEIVRHYYKYIIFEQPLLTENGTMGGNSFAVSQSSYYEDSDESRKAWQAFDDDSTNTRWQNNNINLNSWYDIMWYNPSALYITSLNIKNNTGSYSVKDYVLYGSNDNSNWIQIVSGTNDNESSSSVWTINILTQNIQPYKYFKLSCKGRVTTSMQIRNIKINAYTGIEESTSSDYDFYKDMNDYKIIEDIDEYKAFKI